MAILESFEVKHSKKYRWRFVVKDDSNFSLVLTDWQWCEINNDYGFEFWRDADSFPTYNFNDGTYLGLPKFLSKEYKKHNLSALYDKWLDIKINEYYENNHFKVGDILNWDQYCGVLKYIESVTSKSRFDFSIEYFSRNGEIAKGAYLLLKELPNPQGASKVTV